MDSGLKKQSPTTKTTSKVTQVLYLHFSDMRKDRSTIKHLKIPLSPPNLLSPVFNQHMCLPYTFSWKSSLKTPLQSVYTLSDSVSFLLPPASSSGLRILPIPTFLVLHHGIPPTPHPMYLVPEAPWGQGWGVESWQTTPQKCREAGDAHVVMIVWPHFGPPVAAEKLKESRLSACGRTWQ